MLTAVLKTGNHTGLMYGIFYGIRACNLLHIKIIEENL